MKLKTFSLCSALLVIFSGPVVFPQQQEVQQLVDLDHNHQSFKITGAVDYDYITWFDYKFARTSHSMASGDINGDGREDLVFSSPYFMTLNPNQQPCPTGKVYVIYGRDGCIPFEDIDLAVTPADIEILADTSMVQFDGPLLLGASVAVGRVNGDRFDDIIIGQPVDGQQGANHERVYIVYGSSNLPQTINLAAPLTPVTEIIFNYSPSTANFFGCSIACGDFDGDGCKDILIGNSTMDSGPLRNRAVAGEAYVIFGFQNFQNVRFLDITGQAPPVIPPYYFKIFGAVPSDHLGASVTSGDLSHDHDGMDDIVISAPEKFVLGRLYAGAVYVIFGGSVLRAVGDIDLLTPPPGLPLLRVYGSTQKANLGTDLATGNLNGDLYDDLVMGETGIPNNLGYTGKIWTIEGGPWLRTIGAIDLANLDFHEGWMR